MMGYVDIIETAYLEVAGRIHKYNNTINCISPKINILYRMGQKILIINLNATGYIDVL